MIIKLPPVKFITTDRANKPKRQTKLTTTGGNHKLN